MKKSIAAGQLKILGLAAIAVVMVLQALYAVKLNADFYKVHAPFFDSVAYTDQLADYACVVIREGYRMGVSQSLAGNVALPWLEMTALAKIVTPSRALGVWLQAVWLAMLAFSIYWYLVRYRAAPVWLGFCLTLPFISFAQIYFWNGGLPDFRMDLSLYIFTSLCAVWYLVTYETDSRIPWLLAGIAAMLGCLARATAPVYLLLMVAPLIAIRFWNSPGRRKALALNCAVMTAPVLLSALVFLLHNFHNLYQYYVIWSPHTYQHHSLAQSYPHLLMAFWHIGGEMVGCAMAAFALNFALNPRIGQIDWRIPWLAYAGPLFLFFSTAALNPYVSLPGVFGCLLFAYLPFRGVQPVFSRRWACLIVAALAVSSSLYNAANPDEIRPYKGRSHTLISGYKSVIEQMSQDVLRRGLRKAEFIAPTTADFNCMALENVIIYDYGAICDRGGKIEEGGCGDARTVRSGVTLQFRHHLAFTATDDFLWKRNVSGASDQDKMNNLVSMAMQSDYLLMPDEHTLDYLESHQSGYLMNLRTRELKTRLLATGAWVQLGPGYPASENETIEVYARRRPDSFVAQ